MSYAGAADTGPCEGRQASPLNPTGAGKPRTKEPLTETFVFRCTAAEKAQLRAKAEAENARRRAEAIGKVACDPAPHYGNSGAASSPIVSGSPSTMLAHCTA